MLYLLGSVHVGRDKLQLGPAVAAAYEASEELVVEVDLARVDPVEAATLTLQYGTLPPSQSLRGRLSEETYTLLADFLAARGMDVDTMERLKPWLVATTVLTLELGGAGYQAEYGVDRALMGQAEGVLPIVGLETFEGQIRMLDGLSPESQELMLRDTLVRSETYSEGAEGLLDAWYCGDEERLTELLFAPAREHPELRPFYETVFFVRNESMSRRLAELSRDGKTRLVVVGAGHMLGPRGIPALLRQRGFGVERVYSRPARRAASRVKNWSSSSAGPAAMPHSINVFSWL